MLGRTRGKSQRDRASRLQIPPEIRKTLTSGQRSVQNYVHKPALDLYTHSIVAFRLALVSNTSVDIAMLLRDVVMPLPMREGWGEDMEWPCPGAPAALVAEFAGHPARAHAAGAHAAGARHVRTTCTNRRPTRRLRLTVTPGLRATPRAGVALAGTPGISGA